MNNDIKILTFLLGQGIQSHKTHTQEKKHADKRTALESLSSVEA